jgi:predicted PolB exonuclease-like 3'-5' exonuclease
LTPILVFDLETIPDVAGMRRMGWVDPQQTDAEAVEHVVARRVSEGQTAFLPPFLQRIWVFGCAFRDAHGFQVRCLGDGYGYGDADETQRLRQFFGVIDRHTPQLVTWNGSVFDLPVIHHRALMRGVVGAQYWDTGEENRDFRYNNYLGRYHSRHTDLMDVLASYSGRGNAPLDAISQLCGLPGKLGEDGAQVWASCLAGRAEEVAAYCETDVVNTYLLFQRFRMIRGEIQSEALAQEYLVVRAWIRGQVGLDTAPLRGRHWEKFLDAWVDDAWAAEH